jgi:hypothetical protein
MHEFSGRATSLLANYDQSLLVLVLSAQAGGELEQRHCTAVPWRTVAVQDLPAALRRYVAAGNLALIDAKLRDDLDDGGRWYTRIVRFLLRGKTRKALRELAQIGFPVDLVTELPRRQKLVEQQVEGDLAALAEPSAELLAAVFAHGAVLVDKPQPSADLARFGAAVARAVYGLDALQDHDDDRHHGRFNAVARLAQRLGHETAVEAVQRFVEHAAVEAQQAATQWLPEERQRMVSAILQQLTQRASECRDHLLGRPRVAAMRAAEAGDCDCACSGCDGCDTCDGGCHGCTCCCDGCDLCSWCGSGSKTKKQKRGAAAPGDRPSGMPMR